jgi:serine phosphatase RsbU (regulator of sigma subunit)
MGHMENLNMLDQFAGTLDPDETEILSHLREFIAWHVGSTAEFVPSSNDDVALRTYLMEMKMNGVRARSQREQMASLRRFYDWAEAAGYLSVYNPFQEFSIERPRLTREQIRRRQEIFSGSPEEREIARLRALNALADQLNRSSDMESTLTAALETLLSSMSLQTAWAFLLPNTHSSSVFVSASASDKFMLAAACGLPPGLEKYDRRFLKDPELCHCQAVMLRGQLKRAVNVVECTRLLESAQDSGDNQGLLYHASVPIIASGRLLGIINVATQEWQFLTAADLQLLSAVGAQVAVALERARLFDVAQAQRLRLERELKLAREVQESLLPDVLPSIPGFSLAADWRSALEMAGDFYDVFPLPEGRWGMVVADVSDKGAAAAMYMAMTRSLIRMSAVNFSSPAGVLNDVNQQLLAHSSSDMFVTVFYAALDPRSQELAYANGGHNPPILRRVTGNLEQLMPTGMALGVMEHATFTDARLRLASGDLLVIYTDGVTEAFDVASQQYGLGRLIEAVTGAPAATATLQLVHLTTHLSDFIKDMPPFDDITFLLAHKD